MNKRNTSYHQARLDFGTKISENPELLPHRYVFVLTNRCNLKCSFCFQERNHIEGSLTTNEWLNVVRQLPEYAHVTLTGGEPFIFKGFREIFLEVTERFTCNIISNGLLLTEELIELLLSRPKFKVLSISVDNIGNTVRDVNKEKWRKAEELIRYFAKRRNDTGSKVILDTKTIVLDENAEDLYAIHRYCVEDLAADTHSFMLLKGHPIQHADYMFPIDAMFEEHESYVYKRFSTIIDQFEKVRQYNQRNGKRCFTHPKIADLNGKIPLLRFNFDYINRSEHIVEDFHPCTAPWGSVHINVEGNLFPCMAINMGNVKESPLKDIIHSQTFKTFKDTIRSHRTTAGCNRCGYLVPRDGIGQPME